MQSTQQAAGPSAHRGSRHQQQHHRGRVTPTSLCQPKQGKMLESTSGVPDTDVGGCPVFECLVQRLALNYLKDENSPHENTGAALTC